MIALTGFVIITPFKNHPRYLYYCLTTEKYTNYLIQIIESHISAYPSFSPDIVENSKILKPPDNKARFIGEFEDSELRVIPKGWKISKLDVYIEFIKGKIPNVISTKPLDINFLSQILISSIEGESNGYANPEGLIVSDIFDPIIEMDGASSERIEIGYKGVVGSPLSKIISKDLRNFFIYLILKQKEQIVNSNVTGTAIPHTDKNLSKNFYVILSPKKIIEKFSENVKNVISRIISNKKEAMILSKIREFILPQLISGRIRIENPERFLEGIKN